ncbi:DNA mobilization endonuclease VirD1/MobC family subunit [Ponticoccus litoralis]|uniref:DNA mobilization endonuclease VirD1/MobC family subunit n=1 Tax=Ponticoccus litoralis TaxID=422297 RepID=A0AAW9SQA3_9RHOB
MIRDDKGQAPWKSRRMKGGNWVGAPKTGETGRVDRPISVKMTADELTDFDREIERRGLNRNRALRIAVRRVARFVEVDTETLALLKNMDAQLSGIARNVNQIAKAANQKDDPHYQDFMKERALLGKELMRVQDKIRKIMDTAQRRGDADARLQKAGKQ